MYWLIKYLFLSFFCFAKISSCHHHVIVVSYIFYHHDTQSGIIWFTTLQKKLSKFSFCSLFDMIDWSILYGLFFALLVFSDLRQYVHAKPLVPCYFIFGDSLVDSGNNNNLQTRARVNYSPYGIDFPSGPTGRYTNGRTTADLFGLPLYYLNSLWVFLHSTHTLSIFRSLFCVQCPFNFSNITSQYDRN